MTEKPVQPPTRGQYHQFGKIIGKQAACVARNTGGLSKEVLQDIMSSPYFKEAFRLFLFDVMQTRSIGNAPTTKALIVEQFFEALEEVGGNMHYLEAWTHDLDALQRMVDDTSARIQKIRAQQRRAHLHSVQ